MRRRILISIFAILFTSIPLSSFADTETMTMSTYYPSPFGAYDILRLIPRDGAPTNCADGTLYVDSTDNNELHICGGGSGPGSNDNISVWEQSGQNIYPRQGTGQNVGIGTEAPSAKLEVVGGAAFDSINVSGAANLGSANVSGNAAVSGNVTANNVTANNNITTNTLTFSRGSETGELKVQYISGAYYATYAP